MSISAECGLSSFFVQDFLYYTNAKIAAKGGYLSGIVSQLRESSVPFEHIASLVSKIAIDCFEEGSFLAVSRALKILEREGAVVELGRLGEALVGRALDQGNLEIAQGVVIASKNPFYRLSALQVLRNHHVSLENEEAAVQLSLEIQQLPIPFEEKKRRLLPKAQQNLQEQRWKRALSLIEILLGHNQEDIDCIRLKLQCLLEMQDWGKIPPFAVSLCYALKRSLNEGILHLLIHISDLCYEKGEKDISFRLLVQLLEVDPHQRCCLYRLMTQHAKDQERKKIGKALCAFLEKDSSQKIEDRMDWLYKGLKAGIEKGEGVVVASLVHEAWKLKTAPFICYLTFSHLLLECGNHRDAFAILQETMPWLECEAQVKEASSQILELLHLRACSLEELSSLIIQMRTSWEKKIDILFLMGQLLLLQKEKGQAQQIFQCILNVNPQYTPAAHGLAQCS